MEPNVRRFNELLKWLDDFQVKLTAKFRYSSNICRSCLYRGSNTLVVLLRLHLFQRKFKKDIKLRYCFKVFFSLRYSPSHEKFVVDTGNYGSLDNLQNPYASNHCYKLFSTPYKYPSGQEFEFKFLFFNHLKELLDRFVGDYESVDLLSWPYLATMFHLFHPQHAHYPDNINYRRANLSVAEVQGRIESDIVDCSQKNVFIAKSDRLKHEEEFLSWRYYGTEFHTGKEKLNPQPFGFLFDEEGLSKIPEYYKGLIETGIYARIEAEVAAVRMEKRVAAVKQIKKVKSFTVGLEGGLLTLFILCGIMAVCFILTFCFECRIIILELFVVLVNVIVERFRKLVIVGKN